MDAAVPQNDGVKKKGRAPTIILMKKKRETGEALAVDRIIGRGRRATEAAFFSRGEKGLPLSKKRKKKKGAVTIPRAQEEKGVPYSAFSWKERGGSSSFHWDKENGVKRHHSNN